MNLLFKAFVALAALSVAFSARADVVLSDIGGDVAMQIPEAISFTTTGSINAPR